MIKELEYNMPEPAFLTVSLTIRGESALERVFGASKRKKGHFNQKVNLYNAQETRDEEAANRTPSLFDVEGEGGAKNTRAHLVSKQTHKVLKGQANLHLASLTPFIRASGNSHKSSLKRV